MNLTLICVGKLKEEYFRSAAAEYEKRLSAFCRFSVRVIEPERLPEEPSAAEINAALEKEGERILKSIPDLAFVTAMCVEGKQLGSEKLAAVLEKAAAEGNKTAVFIIGSSYGLCEKVKSAARQRLSMSEMTFPHQLARVMLTEQLYRAQTIINNRKYHK